MYWRSAKLILQLYKIQNSKIKLEHCEIFCERKMWGMAGARGANSERLKSSDRDTGNEQKSLWRKERMQRATAGNESRLSSQWKHRLSPASLANCVHMSWHKPGRFFLGNTTSRRFCVLASQPAAPHQSEDPSYILHSNTHSLKERAPKARERENSVVSWLQRKLGDDEEAPLSAWRWAREPHVFLQEVGSSKEMNCLSLSRYWAYSSMSLWPAPSTHRGSTARGQRSYMARPWEKSMTSSSVPWITSTGDATLDTLSMLEGRKTGWFLGWGNFWRGWGVGGANTWRSCCLWLSHEHAEDSDWTSWRLSRVNRVLSWTRLKM